MGFDMNSGYSGWSMSKNAVDAYESGEMPKSKWTKTRIIQTIASYCDEFDLSFDHEIEKLKKEELFDRFIEKKSWHHTSKFCNATDFYGLNEEAVCDTFPKLSEERRKARDEERASMLEARRASWEKDRAESIARMRRESEYTAEHGFAPDTVAAYRLSHPENCEARVSRKGNEVIEILREKDPLNAGVYEAKRQESQRLYHFNAVR